MPLNKVRVFHVNEFKEEVFNGQFEWPRSSINSYEVKKNSCTTSLKIKKPSLRILPHFKPLFNIEIIDEKLRWDEKPVSKDKL